MDTTQKTANILEIDSKTGEISNRSSSLDGSVRETSGTPDLLRSVKNLRENVSRLEAVRSITDEKIFRLVHATGDYTDLLARKPPFVEDPIVSDSDSAVVVDKKALCSDLLEDESVRNAFNRLIGRVSQLENAACRCSSIGNRMDHGTSMPSLRKNHEHSSRNLVDNIPAADRRSQLSQSSSNDRHISDMERGRGAAVAPTSLREIIGDNTHNPMLLDEPYKDLQQYRTSQRNGFPLIDPSRHPNRTADSRPAPDNVRLNGSLVSDRSDSTSLRRLSDAQLTKLKKFQETLSNEIRRSQEQLSSPNEFRQSQDQSRLLNAPGRRQGQLGFSPPKRLADLEQSTRQRGSLCPRCGSQIGGCSCVARERPVSQTQKTIVPPLTLPLDEKSNERRRQAVPAVGRRGRSPVKATYGTQTSFTLWKPQRPVAAFEKGIQTAVQSRVQNNASRKRSCSVPTSSRRGANGSGRGVGLENRAPPFVSCKSAGPSHSVLVNLQQLLALLKVQNPFLYHACQNLNESDKGLKSLADLFLRELTMLLRKRKDELKTLLIAYDALAASGKADSSLEERNNLRKRLKKLAHTMEMKDMDVQRLQNQLRMLTKLREELNSTEQNLRPCKLLQAVATGFLDSEDAKGRSFAKPTTSTILKCASARVRSKSLGMSKDENVRALRDVKMIANVMSAC